MLKLAAVAFVLAIAIAISPANAQSTNVYVEDSPGTEVTVIVNSDESDWDYDPAPVYRPSYYCRTAVGDTPYFTPLPLGCTALFGYLWFPGFIVSY